MKTYLYCQSDDRNDKLSAERQEAIARKHGDGNVIHEASRYNTPFTERLHGGWLLRNVRKGDMVVVVSLRYLGASILNVLDTLLSLHRKRAKLTICSFKDGPIHLEGAVFALFIDLFKAIAFGLSDINKDKRRERRDRRVKHGSVPNGRWGCKLQPYMTKLGVESSRRVWDSTQLGYCADIARRLLLEKEPVEEIIKDFHERGIKDHTGSLFGTTPRKHRKTTTPEKDFIQAARFFMQSGREGFLPPQWTDVAMTIIKELKKRQELSAAGTSY